MFLVYHRAVDEHNLLCQLAHLGDAWVFLWLGRNGYNRLLHNSLLFLLSLQGEG